MENIECERAFRKILDITRRTPLFGDIAEIILQDGSEEVGALQIEKLRGPLADRGESTLLKVLNDMTTQIKYKPKNLDQYQCCDDELEIYEGILVCRNCGRIDRESPIINEDRYPSSSQRLYKHDKHFSATMERLQGMPFSLKNRFMSEHIEKLKTHLRGVHSLKNIHKCLPNKDQKFLNFFYREITGQSLYIEPLHYDFIERVYRLCYSELMSIKRECKTRQQPRLNIVAILKIIADSQPSLHYIKPFLYTKFNLSKEIKARLENVCSAQKLL